MIVRLDHAHIFASDIDVTIHFYTELLGAKVVYDTQLIGQRNVRLDLNGLALHIYDQPPRSRDRGLIHHLGFTTDDLGALVTHMRDRGVTFRKPITEAETFRYVMCEAPDGILLELYEVVPGCEWMLGAPSSNEDDS